MNLLTPHTLTVRRTTFDDTPSARDADGQPAEVVTTTTVYGHVQSRKADELDDSRSAGSEISDHVIYFPLGTDVIHSDALVWDGQRYQITAIRPKVYGALAHLEVDARLVTSTPVTVDAS